MPQTEVDLSKPTQIVAGPNLERDQQAALAFLTEYDIDTDDCFGIAFEPSGSEYIPGQFTFTIYDYDSDGAIYLDSDGEIACYKVKREARGPLPEWWARHAEQSR